MTELQTNDEIQAVNPLDVSPEIFKSGLDRRKTNRDALMKWIKDSLVDGIDFGRIHIISKKKCPKGNSCTNKEHFAKPSLFKPGAEKICGMLGLTPTFPNLHEYETLVLNGGEIRQIILRCEMVAGNGQIIAEGVGARSVKQDYFDLNKSLKMCLKSAQIDATLRCAGLSEVFTQDVEDMNFNDEPEEVPEFDRKYVLTFGKHQGKNLKEIPNDYLDWLCENANDEWMREFAGKEIEARIDEEDQTQNQANMDEKPETPTSTSKEKKKWPTDYTETEIRRLLVDHYIPKVDVEKYKVWKKDKIGNRGFIDLEKAELAKFVEDLVSYFDLKKGGEDG